MVFDSVLKHVTDEFTHRITMGRVRPTEKPLIQERLVADALAGDLPQ